MSGEITIALAQTAGVNDNEENLRRMAALIAGFAAHSPPIDRLSGAGGFGASSAGLTSPGSPSGCPATWSRSGRQGGRVQRRPGLRSAGQGEGREHPLQRRGRHRAGRRVAGRRPQAAFAWRGAAGVPPWLPPAALRDRVRPTWRDDRLGRGVSRGRAEPHPGRRGADRGVRRVGSRSHGGMASLPVAVPARTRCSSLRRTVSALSRPTALAASRC